jgi:hypothetical protein
MSATPQPQVFLLHGMKRSGNHAIVNWLLPQLNCQVFNNASPLGPLLRGAPMPTARPFDAWRIEQEERRRAPVSRAMVTLEDHDLRLAPFSCADVPLRRLLVLRNPRDLFSSRIRKASRVEMPAYPRVDGAVLRRAIELWKQHARCYLGDAAPYPGRTAILFDAWFQDARYRAAISDALGVAFDDTGFGKVTAEGGGSSFDGTRFDGNARLMDVGNRVAALDAGERSLLDTVLDAPGMRDLDDAIRAADPVAQITLR